MDDGWRAGTPGSQCRSRSEGFLRVPAGESSRVRRGTGGPSDLPGPPDRVNGRVNPPVRSRQEDAEVGRQRLTAVVRETRTVQVERAFKSQERKACNACIQRWTA